MKNWWKITLILSSIILTIAGCAKGSDPVGVEENPLTIIREVMLMGEPYDLVVTDTSIYTTEDQAGWSIHDRNTGELWYRNLELENTRHISVVEASNRLFVHDITGSDGINVYDITDPYAPQLVGNATGNTQNLSDILFIPNPGDFPIYPFDIVGLRLQNSNPTTLYYGFYDVATDIWQGSPGDLQCTLPNDGNRFIIDDQFYYVAGEQRGVYIYNRTDFSHVATIDTPGEALDVALIDGYIYVADRQNGLQVIDATIPAEAVLLPEAEVILSSFARSIDASDTRVAIGTHGGGVYVFDISDRAVPVLHGNLPKSDVGYLTDLQIHGNEVILASRDNGLVWVAMD